MLAWLRRLFGSTPVPKLSIDTSPGGVYSKLRHRALTLPREEVPLTTPPIQSPIWGMVLELDLKGSTMTLFGLADGTTSLYLSTGGGVIGGQGYETVRKAVATFLDVANGLIAHLKPTQETPVPEANRAIFYARTDAGFLTASASQAELSGGRHPLSPLFFAANAVLTELRLVSEAGKKSP